MISRKSWLAAMLLLVGTAALAETSFRFLSMDRGPHSSATGTTGAARSDGRLEDSIANPAALAWLAQSEAWSSYGALIQDSRVAQAGYGFPSLKRGGFAVRLMHLGYDPIEAYDVNNDRSGTLRPSGTIAAFTWGREIHRGLAAGASIKLFQEDLGPASAAGQALDLGVTWRPLSLPKLTLGATARNMGTGAAFDREKERLPGAFTLGAAYAAFSDRVRVSLDAEKEPGREDTRLLMGGEYWVADLLALRVGYRSGQDAGQGTTGGLGFKLSPQLHMDYSYAPFGELGSAHKAGLSLRFGGGKAQALYEQGVRELRREDYAEAVLLFDQALTLNPRHNGAVRMMKEASEKLKASASK